MENGFERDTDKTFDMTFQCNMVARKNVITSCGALGHEEEMFSNPVHMGGPKKYIQFWATYYTGDCAKLEWIQRTEKQLLNGWIYEER